ncbi:conserved hypothetical protein [Pantoea brenneri]|uniref:Uncharacterized protein n=1 Tax=Pantoea brenneri TaxID=472694 RepID=A0AAX3J996_9GAMM|nr:conserved hypothetical protein [Pantoea brenneri]
MGTDASAANKQKPRRSGVFSNKSKLTVEPPSFIKSVVDSHSALSALSPQSKNPAEAGFLEVVEADR